MKRRKRTYTTQSFKNSDVSSVVPTHIMLLSRNSAAFIPSVTKSYRFHSQQYVQIPRFDTISTATPDVGLLLCLVRLVVCWDCHVTALHARLESSVPFSFHSTETSSAVLSKLNRYASQRSVRHRLCYKTIIRDVFAVRLHVLLAGFSSRCLSAGLRIRRTEQGSEIISP